MSLTHSVQTQIFLLFYTSTFTLTQHHETALTVKQCHVPRRLLAKAQQSMAVAVVVVAVVVVAVHSTSTMIAAMIPSPLISRPW